MKTNWEHEKKAITTDQKNRTDDEQVHEQDKRRFKASENEKGEVRASGTGSKSGVKNVIQRKR